MAKHSLNHIVLSPQELIAFHRVITLGCDAFKTLEYPSTYGYLIEHIYRSIAICAIGVTLTEPLIHFKSFSNELDKLSDFIKKVGGRPHCT